MIDSAIAPVSAGQILPTGTCILAQGVLEKPSAHGKQTIELKVEKMLHVGTVEQDKYPLSRKRLPLDSLRDYSHIRPRTTMVSLHPLLFFGHSVKRKYTLKLNLIYSLITMFYIAGGICYTNSQRPRFCNPNILPEPWFFTCASANYHNYRL